MINAIRMHETGGPEVLKYEEVGLADPGPGEVRIRHTAIGVNFIDTYFRSGLYPMPGGLPGILGSEGAGIVDALGEGVSNVGIGQRVAYSGSPGSYAQARNFPADRLIVLPDDVDDRTAAAMMLKGMTAQYLLRQTFKLEKHHVALFHAAAGGVGQIAGQWARSLGATIIGTVGSEAKADLARNCGYTHVINYNTENFVERIKEITDGKLCDVVYDSVGRDTYPGSLDCLKQRGMWVTFGQSSGPLPDFSMSELSQRGSLFATRPTLFNYIETRAELEHCAGELLSIIKSGDVKISIGQEFALEHTADAHRSLEGRKTTGSTILIP
ncbi:MAG: quinone oxidoreductase [Hyphomicrobiales bacterium]|nr:MAG: quinone oxidoreductase [Hyphomicrobiales bacterium]